MTGHGTGLRLPVGRRMVRRIGPPAAWTILAVLVVAAGSMVALVGRNDVAFQDTAVAFALPFLSLAVVGAVVAARRPELSLGWLLLVMAGSITGYAFLEQYATYALVTRPGGLPGAHLAAWLRVGLWVPAAVVMLVVLPLLFPTGAPPSPRWRAVGWVAVVTGAMMVAVRQIAAWPLAGIELVAPGEAWVQSAPLAMVADRLFPVLLACSLLAVSSLVVRFRRATGVRRLQLRWVMHGFRSFLALFLLSMVFRESLLGDLLTPAGIVVVAASLGISILRYRLYDIDRVVSRTLGYALVTAVLVGIYAGAVILLGAVARAVTGSASDLVVAVSTLVVAAAFRPVRQRVQAVVDRRFNRARYDAERTNQLFAARLRNEVDLSQVRGDLVGTVRHAVAPASVSLWLPGEARP